MLIFQSANKRNYKGIFMEKPRDLTVYDNLAGQVAMGIVPKQVKLDIDDITLNRAEQLVENGAKGKGKDHPIVKEQRVEEERKKIRDFYAEKALKGGGEAIKADAEDARAEIHNRKIRVHNERLENDPDYAEMVKKAGMQLSQAIKIEGESGQLPPKTDRETSKGRRI